MSAKSAPQFTMRGFSSAFKARASASCYQRRIISTVNLRSSESIKSAQLSHNQIPFAMSLRCVCDSDESNLGPPGDAAVICAATPLLKDFVGVSDGPKVGTLHFGFAHKVPTRLESTSRTDLGNSSRIPTYRAALSILVRIRQLHWGRGQVGETQNASD